MKKRHPLVTLLVGALDAIEIYVPLLSFVLLILAFLLQIFFRYFLVPLTWPEEFVLLCFIWTALLGGLYAKRTNSHVKFTVIYDALSPRNQTWMRIAGNLLVFAAFCIVLVPAYEYVDFMSFKKSNVLKIPMNLAFSPFVVFLVLMIIRLGYDIAVDIRGLLAGRPDQGGDA